MMSTVNCWKQESFGIEHSFRQEFKKRMPDQTVNRLESGDVSILLDRNLRKECLIRL